MNNNFSQQGRRNPEAEFRNIFRFMSLYNGTRPMPEHEEEKEEKQADASGNFLGLTDTSKTVYQEQ